MLEKKRKRKPGENGDERPNKKIAHASAAENVRVSIIEDVGEWAPAIVTTPGLDFPTNTPLKAYTKTRTDRALGAARPTFSTSELLLHSSIHPKLDYTAREELPGSVDSLLKHYVGVYDPKSGELKLVEARKLVLRGTLRSTTAADDEEEISETNEVPGSRFAARTVLGQSFGTKKSQKQIRSLTENTISPHKAAIPGVSTAIINPEAAIVLESMSKIASSMPSREEQQAQVDEAKPRPKANLAAETPVDVYTIEDLVGIETLKAINVREWEDKVERKEKVITTSLYVSNRLQKVVNMKDVKRLKALKFMLCMFEWFQCLKSSKGSQKKLGSKEDVAKAVLSADPGVLDALRRKFAPNFNLNKWAIDNFSTHACALALAIDHCEVDIYDLSNDLRLDSRATTKYFTELGCRNSNPTESERTRMNITKPEAPAHRLVKLRLPLEFPKQRVTPMKR